jgi:hypothetical protein
MRTRYDILISLRIEHEYFVHINKKGEKEFAFDAFELTPDAVTETSLRNAGLLVKKSKNNWFLLYQKIGPWKTNMEDLVNKEFVFRFSILDSSFAQYTKADFIPKVKSIQFYASTIDQKFFSSSRYIEMPLFDYDIQHTERPVNLKLKKFKGEILKDASVTEPSEKKYPFDVSKTGEQAYDISENTLPLTNEMNREIFVYKNYFNAPFYGMIYFKVFPPSTENSNRYNLLFKKK